MKYSRFGYNFLSTIWSIFGRLLVTVYLLLKSTFILIGPRYFRPEILEKGRVIWVTVIARAPNWQQICGSCEESNEKRCSSRQKGENKSRLMICPDKGLWKLDGQMSNPLLLGGSTTSSIDTRRPLVRCALLAAAAMSKRLQKRLTRLSISPSKRLLSKVDRKGAWEVATKLFFFFKYTIQNTHASKTLNLLVRWRLWTFYLIIHGYLVYFILKVLVLEICNMKWGFAKKVIIKSQI